PLRCVKPRLGVTSILTAQTVEQRNSPITGLKLYERNSEEVSEFGVAGKLLLDRRQRRYSTFVISGTIVDRSEHFSDEIVSRICLKVTFQRRGGLVELTRLKADDAPISVK